MLRGYIDRATRHHICGWALNEAELEVPVRVVVFVNGEALTRVIANRYRADLEAAFGSGRHSFDIYLPGLSPLHRHLVTARIEGCDEDLANTPVLIEPCDRFDEEAESGLRRLLASADTATLERAIVVLAEQIESGLAHRAALQSHEVLRHFRARWFRHRGAPSPGRAPEPPRRALIITAASIGGNVESATLDQARCLRRLGYEVSLIRGDLGGPAERDETAFRQAGVILHRLPFSASVEELLRRQQDTFEVVLVHTFAHAVRYLPLVRHYCANARILFSRPTAFEAWELPLSRARPHLVDSAPYQHAVDATIVGQTDVVISPTSADAERASEKTPGARIHVVRESVSLRPTTIGFAQRRGVFFLGPNLTNQPGLKAQIAMIMDHVWSVDASIPCLIRDTADRDVTEPEERRMIAVGGDTPIAAELDRVRLCVILTSDFAARRMIAESLGFGVPCIAPVNALREMGAPRCLEICDAGRPTEMSAAILRLHENFEDNLRFRKIGLDHVDAHHSEAAVDAAMMAAISKRAGAVHAYASKLAQ